MKLLLALLSLGMCVHAATLHDFSFQNMDLKRAVESLVQLEGKNVVFSKNFLDKKINFSLKQVTPEAALQLLLTNYGYEVISSNEVVRVLATEDRQAEASSTSVIFLSNIVAKDVEPNVKTYLGTSGTVSVNEQRNALVVNCPTSFFPRLKAFVATLDQLGKQIFIQAKIVETSTNFTRNLGIEWGSPLSNTNPIAGMRLNTPSANTLFSAGISQGVSNRFQLEARLTAGEQEGEVKIISSPKITTVNGNSATIESSTTFNVRTLAPVSGANGTGAVLAGSLQQVQSGLKVKVTPFIMSDDNVRLEIVLSKSDPDFSQAVDGIPGINANGATTSLIVKNGQTASIGGLIHHSSSAATSGIPFLASLPVLGILFGSDTKAKIDSETLIFLTPTIF